MLKRLLFFLFGVSVSFSDAFAQEKFDVAKNLRSDWLIYEDEAYKAAAIDASISASTIYFNLDAAQFPGAFLQISSGKKFFVFVDGKVAGEFNSITRINIDSLRQSSYKSSFLIGVHQKRINQRDLQTNIVIRNASVKHDTDMTKPGTYFSDFVIFAGTIIIIVFILIVRLNPKLTSDYFSVARIISLREGDDSQSNARLTSSNNIQFYIFCSLMLSYNLMIILKHLPGEYALPLRFQASGFWSAMGQWLKLSTFIFMIFIAKILLVFSLTRLFGMRGMARIHFFNWVRLLLIVFGAATIVLFVYYISRGQQQNFFVIFLSIFVVAMVSWILVAFFKLSSRSEHSIFHLFSYICATEIIPLLITVKVLFQ